MSARVPQTEGSNPRTRGLDTLKGGEVVALLIDDQRLAVEAVAAQAATLGEIVAQVAARLERGGNLHYVGAGTSGRLGVLDASEIPPTFGTDVDLICAHIAGGDSALRRAIEGAEDDASAGADAMRDHVRKDDCVIGISASGSAAYVIGAVRSAREVGAYTIGIVNAEGSALAAVAERAVVLESGPEAIAGSTRLKAGTAQKIALNAISTAVMVALGKVHDNLMVDVVATNTKLHERALLLIEQLAHVDRGRSETLLALADGRVKVAVVMERHNLDCVGASQLLLEHRGRLRALL